MITKAQLYACYCALKKRITALEGASPEVPFDIVDARLIYASGDSSGFNFNSHMQTLQNGLYDIKFGPSSAPVEHPQGKDYSVTFGPHEDGAARDVAKVSLVQGSKTAAGFRVQVTVDDNGGNADDFANDTWDFKVDYTRKILVPKE